MMVRELMKNGGFTTPFVPWEKNSAIFLLFLQINLWPGKNSVKN